MDQYNGWTNYATWRINLEIFDGLDAAKHFDLDQDAYYLGQQLKDYAVDLVESTCQVNGLALDYAFAFMDGVNWLEIAEHLIDEAVNNE